MADDRAKTRGVLTEGYKPVPMKVQGGYKPATSEHGPPPTGGSAVMPKK